MLKDSFVNINEIKTELKTMEKILESFELKFSLFNQIIAYIFDKIKQCNTHQDAQSLFEDLDVIQTGLGLLLFKYKITMPERLERFVRDFDNFEEAKYIYFEKIKSGEYKY